MRCFVCLTVLFVVGCGQKLEHQTDWTISPGETKLLHLDGVARGQKLVVTIQSDAEVDLWIVKGHDKDAISAKIDAGQEPEDSLGGARKIQGEKKIEATIPAKTPYTVVAGGVGKPTKVKLKLVGS
jgi:hypothetical protein